MAPLAGMVGYGGGGTGLTLHKGAEAIDYVPACFTVTWDKFNSANAGVWSGSSGTAQTDQCGASVANWMTSSNAAWVTTFDVGTDTDYDKLRFSSFSLTNQSNMEIWVSNNSSFSSGNHQVSSSGSSWPMSNDGVHDLTISGTRYRYWRFQNFPSMIYTATKTKPI